MTFVKGPRGQSPEDALLVQFQGMIAEYERAQILERTRRGKTHRARAGTVNVLSGAPFGYRYVRKSEHADAGYEIAPHEAAIVAELFARYADGGVAIAELTRWLSGLGVPTRSGKTRWDRSVIWGMLRNPAYAGRACFGKTIRTEQTAGLNRTARQAGRATPRNYTVTDRARQDWLEIPVPALVDEDTWQRVQRRLEDNKRYASRDSKDPSLLQGICACSGCGYAYYRTSTRTSNTKIYYYRCLGSDDYRYEHGRVCGNKPVRADYLDTLVWDHITTLLTDPALIRTEINTRLEQVRTADPATVQRQRLDAAMAKATTAITRLIGAYQEELVSLDELRTRMPELRARETSLRHQLDALHSQLADREIYLKLADNLQDFLTGLRDKATTATVPERQRVLRLLVKDVLVGPDKITIRHSIPVRHSTSNSTHSSPDTDSEGETRPDCQQRWRSPVPAVGQHRPVGARRAPARAVAARRVHGHLQRPRPTPTQGPAELACHPLCGRLRRARARHPRRRRGPARRRRCSAGTAGSSAVGSQDPDRAHERRVRLLGVPHPVAPQVRHEPVARLHLHRQPADAVVEGEDPCPHQQDVAAEPQGRADPAQPDHARLDQCLKPVDEVGRGVPSRVSSEGQVKRGSR